MPLPISGRRSSTFFLQIAALAGIGPAFLLPFFSRTIKISSLFFSSVPGCWVTDGSVAGGWVVGGWVVGGSFVGLATAGLLVGG